MRIYHKRKLTGHDGERILWHVLHYLQYDESFDLRLGTYPQGHWSAIQTVKQLLGVSVA